MKFFSIQGDLHWSQHMLWSQWTWKYSLYPLLVNYEDNFLEHIQHLRDIITINCSIAVAQYNVSRTEMFKLFLSMSIGVGWEVVRKTFADDCTIQHFPTWIFIANKEGAKIYTNIRLNLTLTLNVPWLKNMIIMLSCGKFLTSAYCLCLT